MKRLIALLTALSIVIVSWSQPAQLMIQGATGKLYLEHTISAKENWYSIGRLYNISPKEIAPFNGLTLKTPLEIGQQIKIPLTSDNFEQNTKKSSSETLVPVYHIVQEKEWMYHISTTYNKVPIEKLEKWNNINKDQAKAGMQLVVGYLKVKTAQSALATMSTDRTLATVQPVTKDEVKASNSTASTVKEEKAEEKKSPVTTQESAAAGNAIATSANNNAPTNTYSLNHAAGGFFGNDFNGNNKSATGQAGTFKSTSGWHDGKYYALMNNVAVGTIIKVTSVSTNKSVYAKVLGQLPEMKESMGLAIRISNSAAAELGTGEGKFSVDIKY